MIRPLRDYVVLQAAPEEKRYGDIIVKSKEDDSAVATVVAVGTGVKDEKTGTIALLDVAVGDKVLFKKYSTTDYKEGDKHYLVIKNDDIIGVID